MLTKLKQKRMQSVLDRGAENEFYARTVSQSITNELGDG